MCDRTIGTKSMNAVQIHARKSASRIALLCLLRKTAFGRDRTINMTVDRIKDSFVRPQQKGAANDSMNC